MIDSVTLVIKYHSLPINLAQALTVIYQIRISNENVTHTIALGQPLLLSVVDKLLDPVYRHSTPSTSFSKNTLLIFHYLTEVLSTLM